MKFRKLLGLFLVLSMAGLSAYSQELEVEPNDLCQAPQDLTGIPLPLVVHGSLDPVTSESDADFFRVSGQPFRLVDIELAGALAGAGTLQNPHLFIWNSGCGFIGSAFLGDTTARLRTIFPEDGVIILQPSECCDPANQGSYQLSVSEVPLLGSISGRVVDQETGLPLPFSFIQLFDCTFNCFSVAFRQSDPDGTFRFDGNEFGQQLPAGSYQVSASAFLHEATTVGPFDVAEGEHFDLGDLALVRESFIGSVSGRVVDAISGQPIEVGGQSPFSFVQLLRCTSFPDDCGFFGISFLDEQARFFITPISAGTGTFLVRVFADQYQETVSMEFEVEVDEHADIGDVAARPLPIQFVNLRPCGTIPSQGGSCSFSVNVRNGRDHRFRGEVWARVVAFDLDSRVGFSEFQIGKTGAKNPTPQLFNLASGQSLPARFQFDVPANVPSRSFFCLQAIAGEEPSPQFDTLGLRGLFCISKEPSGFRVMSEKEARKAMGKAGLLPQN